MKLKKNIPKVNMKSANNGNMYVLINACRDMVDINHIAKKLSHIFSIVAHISVPLFNET